MCCERYLEGSEPVILGVMGIQSPTPTQSIDPEFSKTALNALLLLAFWIQMTCVSLRPKV